jgi:hypothetical protein
MIALGRLGLVANGTRRVTPVPTALLKLVPKPEDGNITIKKTNADTLRDTVPLMLNKIRRTAWQTKKLASVLKGSTLAQTMRNDWNFVFNHIQYKLDQKGIEQVRSPRRMIHEGIGDCDCFSVTIATFLINQGIKAKLRIAKYSNAVNPNEWSHVYIVVPKDGNVKKALSNRNDYYVIDPVVHQFDYEEKPSEVKDFSLNGNMELQYLDGVPSTNGMGCPSLCASGGKNKGSDLMRISYLAKDGIIPTDKFLIQLSVPYHVNTLRDGSVRYTVVKKNGEGLSLPPVVGPEQQKEIIAQLAEAGLPTNDTSKKKWNWVWWLLGGSAAVVLLSDGRDKEKDKNKKESSINGLSGRAKARMRKA